ncbi:MAG: squalene/phytoene synthase family protein [Aestuariivita sp.]|nr:squalene/phytoene synthase family protein [Aestuariivita sp.]
MTLSACILRVKCGDPARFLATFAAPMVVRSTLFPLYAFNLEVARAPWVTNEAAIAEMRLQWWRDILKDIAQGQPVRKHEVATPLAAVISPVIASELDSLVAARRWEIYSKPFLSQLAFDTFLDQTSGTLIWAASCCLGSADEVIIRDLGYAQGLANFFRAVPELVSRGRSPLISDSPEYIQELAQIGFDRLSRARAFRDQVPKSVTPALFAAWESGMVLRQVILDPKSVMDGRLCRGFALKRFTLFARMVTGHW